MNLNLTNKIGIRKFGIIACIFFGCLCALSIWREKKILPYLFGMLLALGLCFLLFPRQFKPVFEGWLQVAHFIGTTLTMLVLTLSFYLVITPAAWLKRLFGGRPLPMKPNPHSPTYWQARKDPAQPTDRFYKRY